MEDLISEEILENLDNLEQRLLNALNQLRENQDYAENVHYIFRFAHNLKSSLAMAGFTPTSQLIHQVENRFDKIRSGKQPVTAELLNLTLQGVDLIRHVIQENNPSASIPAEILKKLEALDSKSADVHITIPENVLALWEKNKHPASQLYLVEKMVSTALPQNIFESLPCFEETAATGKILLTVPSWQNMPQDKAETLLRIWFMSDLTHQQIKNEISDPFQKILGDSENQTSFLIWADSNTLPQDLLSLSPLVVNSEKVPSEWGSQFPHLPLLVQTKEQIKLWKKWEKEKPERWRPVLLWGSIENIKEFFDLAKIGLDSLLSPEEKKEEWIKKINFWGGSI